MTAQAIADFLKDDEGQWVAILACGHRQHVRHNPPLASRPWTLTEEGRAQKLGEQLDCIYCNMPRIPDEAHVYLTTKTWDQDTLPLNLRSEHRTKPDVWGRIVVEEGRLLYEILETGKEASWVLSPYAVGQVSPDQPHRVTPLGQVRLHVEFLRVNLPK